MAVHRSVTAGLVAALVALSVVGVVTCTRSGSRGGVSDSKRQVLERAVASGASLLDEEAAAAPSVPI